MEQRFFESISPEAQEKADKFMETLKCESERRIAEARTPREKVKGSYARNLAERLAAAERAKP